MITIIPNQPIRFQNADSIDESCMCLGQNFCQLINKNDNTQFQIEGSIGDNLVTNGEFDENLDGWVYDENVFEWDEGRAEAHFIGEEGEDPMVKENILEIGRLYKLTFDFINNLDEEDQEQAGVKLDGFEGMPEFYESGTIEVIVKAISVDLIFNSFSNLGTEPRFSLDNIEIMEIPLYTIKDVDGNDIFTPDDDTGITLSGDVIQYEIDWSDMDEGCYQIQISDGAIDYISDCLSVKLEHDCTLLLSWTNDDDAFGFNFSELGFTPKLRVKAKKWKPSYTKEKNVFKDNVGNRTILKSETSKEEVLTISEMPEYLHDALAIGLEHDTFMIDGQAYTNEETEYSPKWRNSSQLAPSEVVVIKDQYLRNNNC
jgi:hypothetical protein